MGDAQSARELARRISDFEPFGSIDSDLLTEIAGRSELLQVGVGERVVSDGEERLFMVLSGLLAVLDQTPDGGERWVTQLVPGDVFIERAPGVPGETDSHLTSLGGSELVALSIGEVAEIMASHTDELETLIQAIATKLRRMHVLVHLSRLFHVLEPGAVRALVDHAEWVALESGELLFRQGDPGDSAYVVINGRLRVVAEGPDGEIPLNEVGRGETLGEMVLVSGDARSATVYAVRDSELAKISRAVFAEFLEDQPKALQPLLELALDRLKRHSGQRPPGATVVTIAVVPGSEAVATRDVARRVAEALSETHDTLLLDRARVESALGRGILEQAEEGLAATRLVEWLNERESYHRYIVYEADADWTTWTRKALRQADHVVLVHDAAESPALTEVEARVFAEKSHDQFPKYSLALLHRGRVIGSTAAWLDERPLDQHYHLDSDRPGEWQRLARMVTGRSYGLVLGGGGARAFAHIGVYRALLEVGVPIDVVGGTSLGAIVASLVARGMDAAEALAECEQFFVGLLDPTLPVVSLLAGRKITRQLEIGCGERQIEDLPLPFFCVSTNLTDAAEAVHRRGPLHHALRCSISLPGILPPVASEGKLHVDGALMNNLPINTLLKLGSGGLAVAVDVSPAADLPGDEDLHTRVSGWKALWSQISPFGDASAVPTITSVIMRGTVVASIQAARERGADELASLYLRPPVEGVKLLDFERIEEISEMGYAGSIEPISEWWSAQS